MSVATYCDLKVKSQERWLRLAIQGAPSGAWQERMVHVSLEVFNRLLKAEDGSGLPPLPVLAIAWPPVIALPETEPGVGDTAFREGLLTLRS